MRSTAPEHLLRVALSMARLGAAATLAAPAVLLGRLLFYLLVMLVMAMLWDIVAAEHDPGALPSRLVLYIGITECIMLSVPAIHLRLEDDIRSGAIEAHLLRPMPYLLGRISECIGGLLVRFVVLGLGGAAGLLLSGRQGAPPGAWPLIVMLALLACVVDVLLFAVVGLSAFWLRRCLAAFLIMQKLLFLLGGLFAPVTFYPAWLATLAAASPFAAGLYWPAMVALQPDAAAALTACAAMATWIVLLGLLCSLIWRAGMRRLLTRGI